MKVQKVVTFEGVPADLVSHVMEMLECDLAMYPSRMPIDSAKLSDLPEPPKSKRGRPKKETS